MNDELFPDGIFCVGHDADCICGNHLCDNSWSQERLVLTHEPGEHERLMHGALRAQDCATVSQLLQSGMQLCCAEDDCFSLIPARWASTFFCLARRLNPSAFDYRGPRGETLLMLSNSAETFEMLLAHGADLTARDDDNNTVLLYHLKNHLIKKVQEIDNCYARGRFPNNIYIMVDKIQELFGLVVKSGVEINAVDREGRSALQILLNMFQPGYVLYQYHVDELIHDYILCGQANSIASLILSLLLVAGAEIPPPDQHGRTAVMLAVQSLWNLDNVKRLVARGVDVKAKDRDGHNAIHYHLASFPHHSYFENNSCCCIPVSRAVDETVCYLLDSGCNLQGMEFTIANFDSNNAPPNRNVCTLNVMHFLLAYGKSLRDRSSSLKLNWKNDPSNLSFLGVFLETLCIIPSISNVNGLRNYEAEDLNFIEQRIASGLDVNSGEFGKVYARDHPAQDAWKKRLCLPYPLLCSFRSMLHPLEEVSERDHTKEAQKQFQIAEPILCLLLPFWRSLPLALLMFEAIDPDFPLNHVARTVLRQRMIKFLHEVGGPLSLGSDIFCAVEEQLKASVENVPDHEEVIHRLFRQLHSKVPTLTQLSRTALRATLEHTDTKGLDVSSMRCLCGGQMIPLPQEVVDFINFRDSPVSAFNDLK